jgi:hypothetical protein
MPKQGLGDIQSHFNPVRVRVMGSGNLQAFLFDTGLVNFAELDAKAMSLTSARSVNYLSNFRAEKANLQLIITEKDEYFNISSIWLYVKPTAASFPQV